MPAKIPSKTLKNESELEHGRLTSLINSMADGVIAIDEQGKIVITNGAALNILDVNSSLLDKFLYEVVNLIDKNNQPIDLRRVIAQTKTSTSSRDWRLKYNEEESINLYISIAPVRLGFGKKGMRGYVLLLRDITREKSLEEERDEFISVVSHELRTPITIAEGNIGNVEFLLRKQGVTDTLISDALKQAHSQVTFLAGLINDLATLSRAERGTLKVEVEDINTHDLLRELESNYTPQAEAKSLHIVLEIDPLAELLKSSRLYVREILQNFITNAIKYTEEGHVTIGSRFHDNGVQFFVADTGIGISKADKEKIFDKFFRSEDFRTRANSGTGLGLYVTLKLARLIHADITFESELNKGSTFFINVPNLS